MNFENRLADIITTTVLMERPFHEDAANASLNEAFDVQDALIRRLMAPQGGVAGYKIAWNTPDAMQKKAMPHPGMGRVMKQLVHQDQANLPITGFRGLMIEAEIVAFLERDLDPGQTYARDDLADAVSGVSVGIELLNRYNSPPGVAASAAICHNIFNAGAIIGQNRVPLAELDMERLTTRVSAQGEIVAEGVNMAPQHPLDALAFLANHFTGRGQVMQAGQLVLCGSHIPLMAVTQPGEVVVSMTQLGSVSLLAT